MCVPAPGTGDAAWVGFWESLATKPTKLHSKGSAQKLEDSMELCRWTRLNIGSATGKIWLQQSNTPRSRDHGGEESSAYGLAISVGTEAANLPCLFPEAPEGGSLPVFS